MELYESEPVLWDTKHSYTRINDAWVHISEILETPVPELKTNEDSLMASFRAYLRRKKVSVKSGAGAVQSQ